RPARPAAQPAPLRAQPLADVIAAGGSARQKAEEGVMQHQDLHSEGPCSGGRASAGWRLCRLGIEGRCGDDSGQGVTPGRLRCSAVVVSVVSAALIYLLE